MTDYSEISIESLYGEQLVIIYLEGVFSIRNPEKEEVETLAGNEAIELANFINDILNRY